MNDGNFVLITKYGVYHTIFCSLGTAKAMRTRCYSGKGSIYRLITADTWEPRLELEDQK